MSLQEAGRISDIPRHWASTLPNAPALWERGRPISHERLYQAIRRCVALLRAHEVGAGDRVMIVAENSVAEVAMCFAASEIHAWPVIVNARLSAREIKSIRAHCTPRLEVFTTAVSDAAVQHARDRHAETHADEEFGEIGLRCDSRPNAPEPESLASQVAMLIYTSGTTGAPKGVMVTHRGLLHFCRTSSAVRGLTPNDITYGTLPLSHIFGIATILLTTLYAGASIYLEPRFDARVAYDTLRDRGISVMHGVPTVYTRLLSYMREHDLRARFPKLRYLYAGGGSLDLATKAQTESAFGLPLHHGYGMTEYAGSMFVTHIDRPRTDCSPGERNVDCEVRLVGNDGTDAPAGEPGELWVRGPGTMLGYYREPALTSEVLTTDGWLRTGDLGRFDAGGALFIVGRCKDLIKRSGFTVYPLEIESELNAHPDVKISAVIGRAKAGDEQIHAFVEMKNGARFDEGVLMEHVRRRIAAYKRPREIHRVEAMPLTPNGKIRKEQLRQLLHQMDSGTRFDRD